MKQLLIAVTGLACLLPLPAAAQPAPDKAPEMPAGIWVSDQGDGTYINPVLNGDFSDPDAVRVGDDYYLTASSFTNVPGLPILHSKDLVNWQLIGYALDRLVPEAHYSAPRHGGAVMAPSIRYHQGRFYIYYPDPDFGIYMVSAENPAGPWSAPVLVDRSKGPIDPAPFWDEDGKAWLVHAGAGSRGGKTNAVILKRLSDDGTRTLDEGTVIIDGRKLPPVRTSNGTIPWTTIEGPKLYKRDGWYYVFAPAGGVKEGWQGVFRSRHIEGPYEARNVMDQGQTPISGPHQGAWVDTSGGEDWFLHFSDSDAYGRRVYLQPMVWGKDGWPLIGERQKGEAFGQPVTQFKKPHLPPQAPEAPVTNDEFDKGFNLAWQWSANPAEDWYDPAVTDRLRLKAISSSVNLWEAGHLLTQKLPGMTFTATTQIDFAPKAVGERAGLIILGMDYGWIGLEQTPDGPRLVQVTRLNADLGGKRRVNSSETVLTAPVSLSGPVYLRAHVTPVTVNHAAPNKAVYWSSILRSTQAHVTFSYSLDGQTFTPLGDGFTAVQGRWVGAQIGLFAQSPTETPAFTATRVGHADFDYFRITP